MNLFLKLLTGTLKVMLFMFLHRRTHQERYRPREKQQRSEGSSFVTDLLIAALLNGGSQ